MIILGIAAEHNSSACLMIDGKVVGLIQEERLTNRKNQVAFPLRAIQQLISLHLAGDSKKITHIAWAGRESDPYFAAIDRYSDVTIDDHITEMHKLWWPHFYEGKINDGWYWRDHLKQGRHLNYDHNYDFDFLSKDASLVEHMRHFVDVERPRVIQQYLDFKGKLQSIGHHDSHAYYALYGSSITSPEMADALVLTADAWGDGYNWSASIVDKNGRLINVGKGKDNAVARIYKYVTLLLGMKPNEHEYKIMGLSGYTQGHQAIKKTERVFFDALDFRNGKFVSDRPLRDSYFDLRERLEGHRFDNISTAMQNWASALTCAWAQYWLKETGKKGICFSGGLSMNIKINGDILRLPEVFWLKVPASGGDESISAGACFAVAAEENMPKPMVHAYLGAEPDATHQDWSSRLSETSLSAEDFIVLENFTLDHVASLLAADCVVARCMGPAEFGARSLGNRSILANPSNPDNVKLINDSIKNRDFWMPFTPSILAEYADRYLENPKHAVSPFMTIGFSSSPKNRKDIIGGLHFGDFSARPQFVIREHNPQYWNLIESFRQKTGVPALLNTSLNLHGEPMNYSLADAARTVALSKLDYLMMPSDRLLVKKTALKNIQNIISEF